MSQEISTTVILTGKNTDQSVALSKTLVESFTTGASNVASWSQTVTTSAASALELPSALLAEGASYIAVKNNDANNFVGVYLESGATNRYAKIPAGRAMLFSVFLGAAEAPKIFLKADTASVSVSCVAVGKIL